MPAITHERLPGAITNPFYGPPLASPPRLLPDTPSSFVAAEPAPRSSLSPIPAVSGVPQARLSVTPEDVWAARLAREAARAARSEAARMRLIVAGIWTVAVVLAATLGIVATRS